MSAGKGMAPRKGYNWAKYAENYDAIFRPNQRKEPMKTPKQEQPDQPTVLPWHLDCARELCGIGEWNDVNVKNVSAIISRHDPHAAQHATTLRLLELSLENNRQMADTYGLRDDIELCAEIRAHLAAMKGSQ